MNAGVEVGLLVPVAYLLGTFPSAALVARRRGSTSPPRAPATPARRTRSGSSGWKAGVLVFALDVLKGALAAGVGLAVDGHRGAYILGVAAVLGHMFPVTRRFKGGRGVATGGGVMLVHLPAAHAGAGRALDRAGQAHAQGVGRVDHGGDRVSDRGRARGPRSR